MLYISENDIKGYERFYRANLINSISGYKPAVLIGTSNSKGETNLAMFSSIIHLGADPALIGFIQRPLGESGHTYYNIKESGFYTINHVDEKFITKAHYTSAKFQYDVSEFDACKLTPEYLQDFSAPFVKESQIRIGLEFIEEIPIALNNTTLVIGKVKCISIFEDYIEETGNIAMHKANIVSSSGLENYNTVTPFTSLPYAKVEERPKF